MIVKVFILFYFSTLFTNYADVKKSFLELSQSPELALVTCVTVSVSAYVVLSLCHRANGRMQRERRGQ